MDNRSLSLAAQIVSAYIVNNEVAPQALPAFIREVCRALTSVELATAEPKQAEPVVAPKKSVFTDRILCLICGDGFKMLKRHISTHHQMTPGEYRAKWNLPASYPMVAADYAERRSKLAIDSGLGQKRKAAPSLTKPKRG